MIFKIADCTCILYKDGNKKTKNLFSLLFCGFRIFMSKNAKSLLKSEFFVECLGHYDIQNFMLVLDMTEHLR